MKHRRKPQRSPALPPNVFRADYPEGRLKALFDVADELANEVIQALMNVPRPGDDKLAPLISFDVSLLNRAGNALKATRLLCAAAYWEFAASAVRQLFELAVNAEYIASQPDREEAVLRYAKFGLLRMVRAQRENILYDRSAGRQIDSGRLAILESMLDQTFSEFRRVRTNGRVIWDQAWSGRTVRELADLSTYRLRRAQYAILYSDWSEQAHGGPGALMDDLFRKEIDPEAIVSSDDAHVAETLSIAVTLLLEIWQMLPHVPPVDAVRALEWTDVLVREAAKQTAAPQTGF